MPEYLAPGVFVEEVSFRSKSIEGVGTSVAGIAGPTRFGPVRGTPEVVTSYNEFERIFGDPATLTFGTTVLANHTAIAARAFFENGGKQLYVSRIVSGGNDTNSDGAGSSAVTAGVAATDNTVSVNARFPGAGGNYDLEITWEDTQNLLKSNNVASVANIPDGATGLLTLTGALPSTIFRAAGTHGGFPLQSLRMLVRRNGADLTPIDATQAPVVNSDDSTANVAVAELGDAIDSTQIADVALGFRQVFAAQPAKGVLVNNTPAELTLASAVDITSLGGGDLGGATVIRGVINDGGDVFTTSATLNGTAITTAIAFNLSNLAVSPGATTSLKVQRNFGIDVIRRKTSTIDATGIPGTGEPVFQVSGLSLLSTDANYLGNALPQNPEKRIDQLTLPITASVSGSPTAAALHGALFELFARNASQLTPAAGSFDSPRFIITLTGGSDGDTPTAVDYTGEIDETQGNTGLASFEDIDDISIVLTPAAAADASNHQAIVAAVQTHCNRMRYRIGVVDSRLDMSLAEIRSFRDNFDDSRLALYYPWVVTTDPTGNAITQATPPSGFIAGIYARTDADRGVHKSPANVPVFGALRFNQEINKFLQELLNPNGINCLRSFPGRGHRVWGGRTLSSDPEWRYVNVRRYFLYLERSIEKGTQWVIFEPNGENLWANIAATVDSFLFNEWKNGRLLGSKPEAAYFVRCDRSTMTQNDIDNGRLVCEIGVAPLRPAEFVIFRIGQKTADA